VVRGWTLGQRGYWRAHVLKVEQAVEGWWTGTVLSTLTEANVNGKRAKLCDEAFGKLMSVCKTKICFPL
jgi:hypothetical protein